MGKYIFIIIVMVFYVSCDSDTPATCGDGKIQVGEECDVIIEGGSCTDYGFYEGNLKCTTDCKLDTSECKGYCGDGIRNGIEICDGFDLGENTCLSRGYYGGEISCTEDCLLDVSDCQNYGRCGNQLADGEEDCDGSDLREESCESLGYHEGTLSCNEDCTYNKESCEASGYCGNGEIEEHWEYCDGENYGGETCASQGHYRGELQCTAYCGFDVSNCERCGDGVIQGSDGEDCDGDALGGETCETMYGIVGDGLTCNHECQYNPWGCNFYLQTGTTESEVLRKFYLEPDGTIVIAGPDEGTFSGIGTIDGLFLIRLTVDGTIIERVGYPKSPHFITRDSQGSYYFAAQEQLLIKYNSSFENEWIVDLNNWVPSEYEVGAIYSITVDSQDNVYVAGTKVDSQGNWTSLLSSFTPTGSHRWNFWNNSGVIENFGENVIGCNGDILYTEVPTFSGTQGSTVLYRLTTDGSIVWTIDYSSFTTLDDIRINPVFCDAEGIYSMAVGEVGNLPNVNYQAGFSNYRFGVAKMDDSGNIQWVSVFGDEFSGSMIIRKEDKYYVSGSVRDTHPLVIDPLVIPDAAVAELDSNGNINWIKQFTCHPDDCAISIGDMKLDENGNIWIGGRVQGPLPRNQHYGNLDAFLIQFHPGNPW